MTKLVIGKDAIEVKAAKKKVLANLRMLNSRLQGRCRNSPSFSALHTFYSDKVEEQLDILEWLERFDQASLASEGIMINNANSHEEHSCMAAEA